MATRARDRSVGGENRIKEESASQFHLRRRKWIAAGTGMKASKPSGGRSGDAAANTRAVAAGNSAPVIDGQPAMSLVMIRAAALACRQPQLNLANRSRISGSHSSDQCSRAEPTAPGRDQAFMIGIPTTPPPRGVLHSNCRREWQNPCRRRVRCLRQSREGANGARIPTHTGLVRSSAPRPLIPDCREPPESSSASCPACGVGTP